ncbi:MAG: restriction endonuclease [Steroidobacteraceae bacterium]
MLDIETGRIQLPKVPEPVMAARRGLVEDLLDLGTRFSWKTCLAAALASAVLLQGLAQLLITTTPPAGLTGVGGFAARNLAGMILRLLGIVVPLALLMAALISALRRSQAASLHQRAQKGGIDEIRRLSWSQFERLIGEAFRRQGYEVQETGRRSGDGGVDLVLARNRRTYLVQCKHWRAQSVGVTVVRELNGVIAARATAGGFIVTSGSFTAEARAFGASCSVELIDGQQLEEMLEKSEAGQIAGVVMASCPKCGSAMMRRVAKKGSYAGKEFWGCSRYPACRGTIQI